MPVDPSSARWVTAGGAVSTNAAGPRSVKFGPVRRWVQRLTLVTADGEILPLRRGAPTPDSALTRRFAASIESTLRLARWRAASAFPKVRKNTAGFALDAYLASGDLLDLVIGAEGTLGFVVDVTWRLGPMPAARAGVRAAVRDVKRLAHCVPALMSLEPSRLEFLDGSFLEFVGAATVDVPSAERLIGSGALLMVEFEGASAADLARDLERAVGILKPESYEVLVANDDRETEALWAVRRAASSKLARLGDSLRSLQVIEDGCVPVAKLGDYLLAVRRAAAARGIPVVLFGHAGDGNVHANLLPDLNRPGWHADLAAVFAEVSREVIGMGGTPSGEHGDGRLRTGLLERLYGFEMTKLFRQLKRTFDPAGLLNPGVKIPGDADPLASLKVGDGAAALPSDIERGLRWIEQHAGYSVARLSLADDPSSRAAAPPS
jgi:FAD/FMN-containing dehydrogenase